jgi:ketosteroid isomerase-like protein
MSRENVEIVRRFVAAFSEGDYEGCIAGMHPDITWTPPPTLPGASAQRGRDDSSLPGRTWSASGITTESRQKR